MGFVELAWKPESWPQRHRFLVIRQEVTRRRKGPLQLDLSEPRTWQHEFKVIAAEEFSPDRWRGPAFQTDQARQPELRRSAPVQCG